MTQNNAFERGYQAYQNGAELTDNPYKQTTFDYQDWEEGFLAAMDDDYSFNEAVGSA